MCFDATRMRRGSVWIPVAGTVCLLVLGGMECVALDQQVVRERLARFDAEHDAKQAQLPRRGDEAAFRSEGRKGTSDKTERLARTVRRR